ncbi:hypothetical protein HGA88_04995 [Candidatus Roizmanbacteria bacterium]|nr:hypothetical protein [Candidatus Roizmanbacteria bacterium]
MKKKVFIFVFVSFIVVIFSIFSLYNTQKTITGCKLFSNGENTISCGVVNITKKTVYLSISARIIEKKEINGKYVLLYETKNKRGQYVQDVIQLPPKDIKVYTGVVYKSNFLSDRNKWDLKWEKSSTIFEKLANNDTIIFSVRDFSKNDVSIAVNKFPQYVKQISCMQYHKDYIAYLLTPNLQTWINYLRNKYLIRCPVSISELFFHEN